MSLKKEDLKEGEIYYGTVGGTQYIFNYCKNNNSRNISVKSNIFYKSGGGFERCYLSEIRLATPEEKHWLEVCKKADKFISKEEALKTFKIDENNPPFKIGDSVYLEKHYKHVTEIQDYSSELPLNTELKVRNIKFDVGIFGNKDKEWTVYFEGSYYYGHPAAKFKPYIKKDVMEDYTGRYIKALVDYPNSGIVRKGEIGKFIDSGKYADFPSQKRYNLSQWKTMPHAYELLPIDYNPEKVSNDVKIEFEVGKWYKVNYEYSRQQLEIIFKCSDYKNNTACFSDNRYLTTKKTWDTGNSITFDSSIAVNKIQALSLEEIQQYLPEGHPDKIKNMKFKKGDYIVCLNTPEAGCSFPKNHIFKQRVDDTILTTELDIHSSKTNGWSAVDFNKKEKYGQWRYATPEEIAEYNRLGKPYDVTTLNKKQIIESSELASLPEKWVLKVDNKNKDLLKDKFGISFSLNCLFFY